jgi:calmodulin
MKPAEAALTIWEVDDDADGRVDWDEFRTMFYRIRDDQTGYEPRKLFNVVEFIMLDKNFTGSIDLDECMSLLYQRFDKAAVDEAMLELGQSDAADAKSVSYTTFSLVQRKLQKKANSSTGLKPGAKMVPQVKELSYGQDPSMAHLM